VLPKRAAMEGTGDFGNTNTESDFQTLAALKKSKELYVHQQPGSDYLLGHHTVLVTDYLDALINYSTVPAVELKARKQVQLHQAKSSQITSS